jgi:EAL domain-containing protein (putative c-di-GMP-specific phosphodiesterase class I)
VVADEIKQCAAFVVVISPAAVLSEWVGLELSYAKQLRRPIFPLMLRGAELPFLIHNLHCEDVRSGALPTPRFVDHMQRAISKSAVQRSETEDDQGSAFEPHSFDRQELLTELRMALNSSSDELGLYLQPQVDIATSEVCGAESVLRWHHPRRGFLDPRVVMRIASDDAIMERLTSRLIQDAVRQMARWRSEGLSLRTSVKINKSDLRRLDFAGEVERSLPLPRVSANLLQLEVTNPVAGADLRPTFADVGLAVEAVITMQRLDRLGVALSLADFGAGYFSMTELGLMPLAELKIDPSFVRGMATNPNDGAVNTPTYSVAS